jgi:hypothetical protein
MRDTPARTATVAATASNPTAVTRLTPVTTIEELVSHQVQRANGL